MKKKKTCSILLALSLLITGIAQGWMAEGGVAEAKSKYAAKVTLRVGEKRQYAYYQTKGLLKKKISNKKVKWKSKNAHIATVSKKGVIRGKRKGKTVVSAKYGKKTLYIKVTIKAAKKKSAGKTRKTPAPAMKQPQPAPTMNVSLETPMPEPTAAATSPGNSGWNHGWIPNPTRVPEMTPSPMPAPTQSPEPTPTMTPTPAPYDAEEAAANIDLEGNITGDNILFEVTNYNDYAVPYYEIDLNLLDSEDNLVDSGFIAGYAIQPYETQYIGYYAGYAASDAVIMQYLVKADMDFSCSNVTSEVTIYDEVTYSGDAVELTYYNECEQDVNVNVVIIFYDADGQIVGIDWDDGSIEAGGVGYSYDLSPDYYYDSDGYYTDDFSYYDVEYYAYAR